MIRTRMLRWANVCAGMVVLGAMPLAARAADTGATLADKGNGNGAPPCSSCHGQRGEGNPAGGFPRLAGLGKGYIERQLAAFANGERQNAVMAPIAKALLPAERSAASAYYARLPFKVAFVGEASTGAGAALATQGRWDKDIVPACVQCHGPNGVGVGDAFPPLAGQSATYIAQQLRAWQEGTRPPGPLGLMKAIATRLAAADVDAVAQYFGGVAQANVDPKAKP